MDGVTLVVTRRAGESDEAAIRRAEDAILIDEFDAIIQPPTAGRGGTMNDVSFTDWMNGIVNIVRAVRSELCDFHLPAGARYRADAAGAIDAGRAASATGQD